MSADLKDLRTKVSVRTWCFLESESRATGRDMAEISREILDQWAAVRMHAYMEAQKLLAAEGESGTPRGRSGKTMESAGITPLRA